MPKTSVGIIGLFWCLTFVILDSAQAVFFGGVLQHLDGFMIGGLVFGLSSIGCILWTWFRLPEQIQIAKANPASLLGLNLSAAGGWLAYFLAIQLVEPAVAFTLFSGAVPITTIVAARFGFAEGQISRNKLEAFGYAVLIAGMGLLACFTLAGWSGFVRGGIEVALIGIFLSTFAGGLIAFMLLYSQRLDGHGLQPIAQFGLRFPLYLILTLIGFLLGIDAKEAAPFGEIVHAVAWGMVLLAFPIYAVQKAVSLVSSLTIGSIAAVSPLIVFLMQIVEDRVAYSDATSLGLAIYFLGAIIAAIGSAKAVTRNPQE